jgi:CBS domain-containing protein
MYLRKITKKKVVTVGPKETVVKAARLMEKKNVGSVVVIQNKKPVGIITDRDIAVRVVAKNADGDSTLVEDVMTKNIVTGREGQRAAELAKVMHDHGIRRIPIVGKRGELTGIITLDDLLYMIGVKLRRF